MSILAHIALVAGRLPQPQLRQSPRLEARLQPIETPRPVEAARPDPDLLEKNTIARETLPVPPSPPKRVQANPAAVAQHSASKRPATSPQDIMRKIARYLVYPPEAKAAGHEGTVYLLIRTDSTDQIIEASVAATSGYPELDHAAIEAVLHVGKLNIGERPQIILPFTMRLQ